MSYPSDTTTLVADIGGTNTRVALTRGTDLLSETVSRYRNAEFDSLTQVLEQFIADQGGVDPTAACVAVAGPVHNGTAKMTNLDWAVDEATLARATHAETVAILNDLQAQGHALGHLPDSAHVEIVKGAKSDSNQPQLVVGIGTGFNIAPVHNTPNGRIVTAAEAGHAGLPAVTSQDRALADYVAQEHGFASIEDVLSGRGLSHVYGFLTDGREMTGHEIMQACANNSDPAARETVKLCARKLGQVIGDLALVQLPFGGIYLVGGVSCALGPYLTEFGMADAMADKGRFSDFVAQFGVYVVQDDYAALIGSAHYLNAAGE